MAQDEDSVDDELRALARAPEVPLREDLPLPQSAATQSATQVSPPPVTGAGRADELPVLSPEVYTIVREHARGGMGRILIADDRRLGRRVAIKELLLQDPASAARFAREALLTARLQHPSIVPVHEAGRWPGGEPFYVMRLVQGRPLSELVRERHKLDDRLALLPSVIAATEAVGYAHAQRVIHRDLKPANIVVGEYGETVVVDWGLAKELIDEASTVSAEPPTPTDGLSVVGAVVGTPSFMAPEQAAGKPLDERADVYALGAILYTTLSGTSPYASEDVAQVVGRVLAGPPVPLGERAPSVPRDLVTIVEKAMARDRDARYASARELAAELKRFQTGQLVAAHRYSRWERVRREIARHRVAYSFTGALALLMISLGSFRVYAVHRMWQKRTEAIRQRDKANQELERQKLSSDQLIVDSARAALALDPTSALALLKRLPADSHAVSAARAVAEAALARGVAGLVLSAAGPVHDAALSPDGKLLCAAGRDGSLHLWDLPRGTPRAPLPAGNIPLRVFFTADSRRLVSAGSDGALQLWDLAAGRFRTLATLAGGLRALDVSDGKLLAAADGEGHVRVFALPEGAPLAQLEPRAAVDHVACSAGAHLIATRDAAGAQLWRAADGRAVPLADGGRLAGQGDLAFSSDGTALAVAGDGAIGVWSLPSGRAARLKADGAALVVRWAADQLHLASASDDGRLRWWDLSSRQSTTLLSYGPAAQDIAFSADGQRLAATRGSEAHVWRLPSGEPRPLSGHALKLARALFVPDGTRLVTVGFDGAIRVWALGEADDALPLEPAELPGWLSRATNAAP